MELEHVRKIYFIGIGGIGMSALARYFRQRGKEIAGYDRTETALTRKLAAEGMQIHYVDDPQQIPAQIDLVVYTPAVPADHRELQYFRREGFPVLKRAEVLGLISRHSRTLAVAGTHGKTTTTSLLSFLLREAGVDCTAFLGGIAGNFGTNYLSGRSDWVVVEADEYDRSFLHLQPEMAVVLSTDPDHLDIYGDRQRLMQEGFRAFARQLKPGGRLFVRHDLKDAFADLPPVTTYGLEEGDYRSTRVHVQDGYFRFDFHGPDLYWKDLQLGAPGRHNVENATAALALALQVGLTETAARRALAAFTGVQRRFERIYQDDRRVYIDDYAHHPTELTAVIGAARELFPGRKLTGIFQPHLYSRTRDFLTEFAAALDRLDEPVLLEIYPAREEPIPGIDSAALLKEMKNPNKRLWQLAELPDALGRLELDVLLTMGAGNIDTLVEPIQNWLQRTKP